MNFKKYLIKIFLFFTIVAAAFVTYLLFQSKHKSAGRTLASYPINTYEIEARSKKMMEESRRLHVIKDYPSANKILSDLLDRYPYTGYKDEASFLLAKGLFYEEQFDHSERVIKRLKAYDSSSRSKWLGYSLLIMGKIHQQRGEIDDSIHLYRQVITEFPDKDLVNEAEDLLNEMSF